jgi:hypothetical protein
MIQKVLYQFTNKYFIKLKDAKCDIEDKSLRKHNSVLFLDNDFAIIPQRILKNHLLLYKEFGRYYSEYSLALYYKNIYR